MAKTHRPIAPPPVRETFVTKTRTFALRHARVITFLSTAVIIIATIVIINHFWAEAKVQRAYQELGMADTSDAILKLKEKYRDTAALPRIQFALGNAFYEEGKLDEAMKVYEDFLKTFPDRSSLVRLVTQSRAMLDKDIQWRKDSQKDFLKAMMIGTSPLQRKDAALPQGKRWPQKQENPRIKITTNLGELTAELLEDEAPNAVAHLIKLIEKKSFDGARLGSVNVRERLQANARTADANYRIAHEPSARNTDRGQIVLIPAAAPGENQTGFFQILLDPVPDLHQKATVVGVITNPDLLFRLNRDDMIVTIVVDGKRSHPYEPAVLQNK